MWELKTIWSTLKQSSSITIATPSGRITGSINYCQGLPYYLFRNNRGPGHLVAFMHGYTDNALLGLSTALDLADNGFTAVLPEARWHGQEQPANFEDLFNSDNFIYSIFKVIRSAVTGISKLTTYLQNQGLALSGEAGICGFSMGAYISYLLPVFDKRFTVAAPVSGSPFHYDAKAAEHFKVNLESNKRQLEGIPEASQYIAELQSVSWLIQHADDDETVSAEGSRKFCQMLQKEKTPNNFKAVFYNTGGHNYHDYMRSELVNWFVKQLLQKHLPL